MTTQDSKQAAPSAECLSDDEILAFAGGHLSSTRRSDAHLHLDECHECQQVLTEAVQGLAMATTHGFAREENVAWNATFRAGLLVGRRYTIRRFIARGGMGEVYEAFDQELQERVALKTVTSTACDNPSAVRRLKAEVQLARRVSHPHVCRIYDLGAHVVPANGAQISFLTMEFADGVTLGQHIRSSGALSVNTTVAIARQLLEGLRAAHAAGILHRDFKSENVMLRPEGESVCPLILDFGLARALEEGSRNSSTEQGLVGTFAYIAPEQLEGKPHTIASDLYSFGIVCFEMLTGELPYKCGSSPVASTLDRLRRPALPPSSINPVVPAALDEIVLQCLERVPSRRFRNADEVLARLDAMARGEPGPGRVRARQRLLVAAGVAALAAGVVLAVGGEPSARPALKPVIAVPPVAVAAPATAKDAPVQPPVVTAEPAPRRIAAAGSTRSTQPSSTPAGPTQPAAAELPAHPADTGWEDPFNKTQSPTAAALRSAE